VLEEERLVRVLGLLELGEQPLVKVRVRVRVRVKVRVRVRVN
jgi:hypothetical protein